MKISKIFRRFGAPSGAAVLLLLASSCTNGVVAEADLRPDCLAIPAALAASQEPAGTAQSAWQAFRTVHPYPYQAFAGRRLPNGKAVLVISEPPPDIGQKAAADFVQELFADRAPQVEVRRTMIGSDGYVEDLVVAIDAPSLKSDDLLSDADLRDRIGLLHAAWFGTSCGGDVETIGGKAAPVQPVSPDLQISPAELSGWLADPAMKWSEIEGEAPTLKAFGELETGAYRSSDGSMVLFMVPQAALDDPGQLAGFRTSFRRFAVSSDAILGASWTPDGKLAFVGRQRTHPLSEIPPLRFETFGLIAAQRSDQLAQSYERGNPLAGNMEAQRRDWAPIFLSDALIDTEFGALLNVTDQMLKSWSMAGQIHYVHFDYPRTPSKFAFGTTSLYQLVHKKTGSNEVLFNWNTAGLGVVFEQPGNTIFVARRLGALPVTYGANVDGGEIETGGLGEQEETAYDYFAKLGDPNLARVVQYTLIYQAITAAREARGQAATYGDDSTDLTPQDKVLVERMRPMLSMMRSADWQERVAGSGSDFLQQQLKRGRASYAALRTRFSEEDILGALANRNKNRLSGGTTVPDIDSISSLNEAVGDEVPDDEISDRLAQVAQALGTVAAVNLDLASIKAAFETASERPQQGWIRTPSVVVSWGTGASVELVGGHNLNSKVVRFEETSSVSGVEFTDGVVRYNPSEAARVGDKAGDIARAVEHGGARTSDDLAKVIGGAARGPRTRVVALELEQAGAPRPVARLGARSFESDAQFVKTLEAMKQKAPCCRIMARNERGEALLVETNAAPPPVIKTTTFGDNVSLGSYLRKNGKPDIIMLDQPSEHISSLLLSAVERQSSVSPFEVMRQRIRGLFRTAPERGDYVIGVDLNGRPGSVLMRSDARLSTEQRLVSIGEAQAKRVNDLRFQRLGAEDVQTMLGELAWVPAKDGLPTGVRVSFALQEGSQRGFIDVLMGYFRPGAQVQRAEQVIQKTIVAAKGDVSLVQLQMTIQNDLRALNDADLGRIAMFVRQDRGAMQTTMWMAPSWVPRV